MSQGLDFLPGCYSHLRPEWDESLEGFLLRLATENSYIGVRDLLKAVLPRRHPNDLRRALREIRCSRSDLQRLGKVACGDGASLLHFAWVELPDGAVYAQGQRIEDDALLEQSQVCPKCLSEAEYARDEWELAPVVCCSKHGVRFHDTCSCGSPLSWKRYHLLYCDCGQDLRDLPEIKVDAGGLEASQDFAAVAPFRVLCLDGSLSVRWDTMCRILRCLALSPLEWTAGEWPEGPLLRRLSIATRADHVAALGRTKLNAEYRLDMLQPWRALLPLNAVSENGAEAHAFALLYSEAGLPESLASTVVGRVQPKPLSGAMAFHGRPPVLRTREDVMAFLDIDADTYAGLVDERLLLERGPKDIGFDIDDVLAARRFLDSGLLDLEQLGDLVGASLAEQDVLRAPLFRIWNRRRSTDVRVLTRTTKSIQLRLIERVSGASRPSEPHSLGALASSTPSPAKCILLAVGRLLDAQTDSIGWEPPFRWADLLIEKSFASVVAADVMGDAESAGAR